MPLHIPLISAHGRPAARLIARIGLISSVAAAGCAPRNEASLTGLCDGHQAEQRVDATVDTVLPYAGPTLKAVKGRHYALRLTFAPPASTGPAAGTAGCQGALGEVRFSGDVPEPIRGGAAPAGVGGWRLEGDTVLVDLNPKARDNNLVMSLPLRGGRGHWALSTFAGEAARGTASSLR